jgi:cyclophilin family peptidyl-prolyl cis-trans isomerase
MKVGILSMATAAPTPRRQFFTARADALARQPALVFGEVVEGMDVTGDRHDEDGRQDRPVTDITIDALTIERVA